MKNQKDDFKRDELVAISFFKFEIKQLLKEQSVLSN